MNCLMYTEYSGESIVDVERDIDEALSDGCKDIPKDEFGFCKGKFTVIIKWEGDEE